MAYKSDYTGSEIDSRLGGDTYLLDEDDLVDNGGTVIEQSNFDSHIATSDAHHSRYADAEAQTAINDDPDHGDTAPHNYFSGSYADLTDVPATFMPEEHGNEAHSETYLTSVPVDSVNGKTGSVTLIKSDVDLGNVPNTDIAYSTTIAADAFTQTEVDNLRAARLDDGSTPWASNNYYSDADVDNHLSGGDGISYSAGTITIDSTVLRNADLATQPGQAAQAIPVTNSEGYLDQLWNNNPITLNKHNIVNDWTIPEGYHGMSVGPLKIDATITINGIWKIL